MLIEIDESKKYLLSPIDEDAKKQKLILNAPGFETYFEINLAAKKKNIQHWTYLDISRFKGNNLSLSGKMNSTVREPLICIAPIYGETQLCQNTYWAFNQNTYKGYFGNYVTIHLFKER